MTIDSSDLEARLDRKFRRDTEGLRRVEGLAILEEGHGGLTYEFALVDTATGANRTSYVLKVAPFGIVRKGNTDVYRQAPLLRALHGAGLPAPDVPFASESEAELGTPYIVMERLPGRTFIPWSPHKSFDLSEQAVDAIWRQTVQTLARISTFDWRTKLANWEQPRKLDREVAYWTPLLDKAESRLTRERGLKLAERLAATLPGDYRVGLVHGDFQPGNILFENGKLTGIIDWELANIGARSIDLGWLSMLADARSWTDHWRPISTIYPDGVHDIYASASGFEAPDIDWYEALACLKLGAITCLNLRLHRSGRRIDDTWEKFALGVDVMFDRGIELVSKPGYVARSAR
jgi:aminoglycoside phosphotransferase (APT) family kinase protein